MVCLPITESAQGRTTTRYIIRAIQIREFFRVIFCLLFLRLFRKLFCKSIKTLYSILITTDYLIGNYGIYKCRHNFKKTR
jgi:hypothetical protein